METILRIAKENHFDVRFMDGKVFFNLSKTYEIENKNFNEILMYLAGDIKEVTNMLDGYGYYVHNVDTSKMNHLQGEIRVNIIASECPF